MKAIMTRNGFVLEKDTGIHRAARLAAGAAMVLACVCGVEAVVVIDTVSVGNPGNAGELSGSGAGGVGPDRVCGAVDYVYDIATFEVTAGQYTEFLNAVAATDTYELYNTDMWSSWDGCKIERNGLPDSYTYTVAADWADRPVNYISWADAARFCNWLHNGQPTGSQDLLTTEDGSYYLSDTHGKTGVDLINALMAVTREADATWVIPTEDEWYKAAYHKNDGVTGNYWDYPMGADGVPSNDLVDPDPGNNGNFYDGSYTIGSPYWRTVVGEFENSESPYDTFDQGGNIDEWNETAFDSVSRVARGGAFIYDWFSLRAAHRSSGGYPTDEYNSSGLRVAKTVPTLLIESEPPADGSLPKTQNNIILCVFDHAIALPPAGYPLRIRDMDAGCIDLSGQFVYSLTTTYVANDTLKAKEDGDLLFNLHWYQVERPAGWTTVSFFRFEVCTLEGDSNNTGRVTTGDYTEVKAHMGERTDARYDLNGSDRVTTADYIVVKSNLGHRAPLKPALCPP